MINYEKGNTNEYRMGKNGYEWKRKRRKVYYEENEDKKGNGLRHCENADSRTSSQNL